MREIRTLRATWRGLETWSGRNASAATRAPVPDPTDVAGAGNVERSECFGRDPRASPRPYLKEISDDYFPHADLITLLQDNLNIHAKSSLYQAFPAPEARRLVQRFEWVYTPKHGSWLDLAESELAVLSGQCLDRRIPNQQVLEREVAAWVKHRNQHHAKADWRFTTETARIKLKHLYPVL